MMVYVMYKLETTGKLDYIKGVTMDNSIAYEWERASIYNDIAEFTMEEYKSAK
jgi:hypothetical protein